MTKQTNKQTKKDHISRCNDTIRKLGDVIK